MQVHSGQNSDLESCTGMPGLDRAFYILLSIYGLVALVALCLIPLRFLPAEDAVILFQYSRNLAHHGAITFLANGPHVEGATDFAWMSLLAAAMKLGIPPFWFCAGVNVSCLVALALLLSKLALRRVSTLHLLPVMGAIALMPQILAAASGFAVLPDAVLLTALVLFAVRKDALRAAILAFAFCLFRPDGIVFAVPILASLVASRQSRSRNAGVILGLFLVPGLLYFVGRWRYFHELLPLPFLVKADTHRVFGLFVSPSLHQSLPFLIFTGVLLFSAVFRSQAKQVWLILPLVVVPTFFYWAMRLDQNVAARFFYYLPLAAAILIAVNWATLRTRRLLIFRSGAIVWFLLIAMPLLREIRTFRDEQFSEVKAIAEALGSLPHPGDILTTEAGFLPYFSGWQTYDAWGLNTPEFAHRFFERRDVEQIRADLVVLHPDRTESCLSDPSWAANYTDRTWPHMTRNLILGANPRDYQLWLTSYGSEFYRKRKHWQYGEGDRECWLIRKDSPLYTQIRDVLASHHGVGSDQAIALETQHGTPRP